MVYAVPANVSRVAKIDPVGETVAYIGPDFGDGAQKWYGGIRSEYNGCIYGIPHNATNVLKMNPWMDEVTTIGEESGLEMGQWKWHGGLSTPDGKTIIAFPNNATSILCINVTSNKIYEIGKNRPALRSGRHRIPYDAKYKYLGGALTQDGRYAYLFPADAERVLRIDMTTMEVRCVGPLFLEGYNKYQNGFCSERDGCVLVYLKEHGVWCGLYHQGRDSKRKWWMLSIVVMIWLCIRINLRGGLCLMVWYIVCP